MAGSVLKAARRGNTRKLRKLLDQGVNVDACDVELQTPLFMSALKSHFKCARLLIERKANPNYETIRGTTSLHAACYSGNTEVISLLVESGGDLSKVSHSGDTPRDCAVQKGNKKAIQLLDRIGGPAIQFNAIVLNLDGLVKAQLSFSCLRQSTSRLHNQSHCQLISSSHAFGLNAAGSRMALSRSFIASESSGIAYGTRLSIPEASNIHLNGRQLHLTADMVLQRGSWRGSTIMVKKPHPERVNDLLVRKVFQEADVLSQLHHPNIVMLMAICNGPSQEDVCIVLELMKRATLDYQLHERRRKFSVYEILVMLAGVADGIHFVHYSGYVHSYLKPESILIGCNLQAKLCNFEYAQRIERTSMSHVSTMFPYMAPEQLRGVPVDEAGDVYSFGCVLWECLTCQVPWTDKDTLRIPDWVAKKKHQLQIERSWPVPVQRLLSSTFRPAKSRPDFAEVFAKLIALADMRSPSSARLCDDPFSECRGEWKETGRAGSYHSFVHNSSSHIASRSSSHHFQNQRRPNNTLQAHETTTEEDEAEQFHAFSIKPLPCDGTISSHWQDHICRLTSPPPPRSRRKSRSKQSLGSRGQLVPQRLFPDGVSFETEVPMATATAIALENHENVSDSGGSDSEFLTVNHSETTNRVLSESMQNVGSCEPSKSLLLEVVDMLPLRIESEEEHNDDDFVPRDE